MLKCGTRAAAVLLLLCSCPTCKGGGLKDEILEPETSGKALDSLAGQDELLDAAKRHMCPPPAQGRFAMLSQPRWRIQV